MITPNPEIELIITAAGENAKKYNHAYVTLEHLLHAMVTYKPFFDLLNKFGINVTQLIQDINDFHDKADYLVSREQDCNPKKTHALERVFNRALTQVLFSGRSHVQIIDIFLSVASEANSHASYFFIKYGLERSQIVDFYNQNYVESKTKRLPANARADQILAVVKDASIASSATGDVYFRGSVIGGYSGLTVGASYFVSAATAGAITSVAPTASGDYVYKAGRAVSATELLFEPEYRYSIG